jgi:DNA gyrase subunit B/topoisomerase-4 subunit B
VTYTAKDITVLEGLEPVRKRPGMYIGGVGSAGLHHLVWEILDNAIDEAMNGYASNIGVTLHADSASITIADDGRGIPVDKHPKTKKSAIEVIFTTLHAGGKFDAGNYKTAGGLHGVGASVVNALSKELTATVKRDGATWEQTFRQGVPAGPVKKLGPARGTGTTISFRPDPTIFPKLEFDADVVKERLEVSSYLHKGVRITFEDEARKEKLVFQHDEGLVDYLKKIVTERTATPIHEVPFTLRRENDDSGIRLDLVVQWTQSTDEHVRSYVNGIPTASGGTHENGFRAGLGKAVRNFIDTHNLSPKGVTLTAEDIREGLVAVLSVFLQEPQFQGQTKDRLNNPEAAAAVDSQVRPALEHWLNTNISVAESIVARIILAARAREASRAAQQEVTRKTATSNRLTLPGKLSDCTSPGREDSELFVVEGDSAGGSAKQGRDRTRQAILPLRGKVLNTESASLAKVLENKELSDLVTALGCGLGKSFDLARLRYGKVIILADADSDGHHIATLLMTFIYRHMAPLITSGRVFLAQPPLYRIDIGKETFWALDDAHRDRLLKLHANGRGTPEITRFKGLGEMMPKVLWETTLNPRTRRLLRVDIADQIVTDRVINELMGKDPSARFRFIMERAEDAVELDV